MVASSVFFFLFFIDIIYILLNNSPIHQPIYNLNMGSKGQLFSMGLTKSNSFHLLLLVMKHKHFYYSDIAS